MEKDVLETQPARPLHSTATSGTPRFSEAWHKSFHRFITGVYFQRMTLVGAEHLAKSGPTLYLGLHRNGAVDGFVYDQVLRHPVFMISNQLRKNRFARLFFAGIAVTRTKDEGDRDANNAALQQCLDHLRSSGNLFVFPEGTSSLGPRHLPFKSGAIWLCLDYLERGGPPLDVVPVGIHYESPWAFRGKVEVVVGASISTDLPPEAGKMERLKTIKRRADAGLREVGINVSSEEYQRLIQCLACVATLGTTRSYFKSLKAMEEWVSDKIVAEWRALEEHAKEARLLLYCGAPLFPLGPVVFDYIELGLMGPIVAAAIALNLPPLLAGWYAGKKFPDDRNVISLWKILVGIPVFALWIAVVIVCLSLFGQYTGLAAYVVVTGIGIKFYRRAKELAVAVLNVLRLPSLRKRFLEFRKNLLESLPDETA